MAELSAYIYIYSFQHRQCRTTTRDIDNRKEE